MKKSNAVGVSGVLLLLVAGVVSVAFRSIFPNIADFLLLASVAGAILGAIAAVLGNRWWFVETAVGLLAVLFILFGLIGP